MKRRDETIQRICEALIANNKDAASSIVRSEYPFEKQTFAGRKYKEHESTKIFIRDGFIDRYSGERLVFPPVLRLISKLLPEEFPFHQHWKMSESHIAYWELFPTVDHIVPVSRGGVDEEINWVTTSMLKNSAKSNSTLEELGWRLLPAGDFRQWDGMAGWLIEYIKQKPECMQDTYIKRWYNAAVRILHAV